MNWSDITCTLNPTWPAWLPEVAALPTLLGAAGLLAVLTIWTYLGMRGMRVRRIAVVLGLRLAALAIALLVALRPSFGVQVLEGLEPSKLLIVVDVSESMNVPDDFDSQSRWDYARRILQSQTVVDALKRLSADEQIEVVFYQAAEGIAPFDPNGPAQGQRTDIGAWLHDLYQKHAGQDKLRGLLLLSDGADNGTRYATLDETKKWRSVCPIHAFGHGAPQDDTAHKDIVVAGVRAAPSPVPAKTKLTITSLVHAPGFQGTVADVGVWIQGSRDKGAIRLGAMEKVTLKDAKNNEVVLVRDAPETPDEYKLILKVDPVAGETDVANNEATTFVQVTKEGVRVLWVEYRKRPYESVFPLRVLAADKRFHVVQLELGARKPGGDPYEFDKQRYDVIVIGDVTAAQFSGGDDAVFEKVRTLVEENKVGLMMLGGIDTFGRGGWAKTPFAKLLPVTLDTDKQLDNRVRVQPVKGVLELPAPNPYPFLALDLDPAKNKAIWSEKFAPLDGMALLGTPREGATVLARVDGTEPILVAGQPGGRVLVFGGDTTWKAWRRPQTLDAYAKFWRLAILWLANQDDRNGNLWIQVAPPSRRLSAGSRDRLDFTFGLKGKTGLDVPGFTARVQAIGPNGATMSVSSEPAKMHRRGSLAAPATPGEYLLKITATGKDADGSPLADEKAIHFVVVSENVELQRKAPDHEHLREIATLAGGEFHRAGETELLKLLGDVKGQVRRESHAKIVRWPDWDRYPASDAVADQLAGLWGSSALMWMLAFAALLCSEWALRRTWGMV